MPRKQLLLLIILLLPIQIASSATLSGRPSRIISGDEILLTITGKQHIRIQLLGIQAPPLKTKLGRAARKRLSTLVAGRPVTVEFYKRNGLGQPLAKVSLGGTDINLRMLQEGLAVHRPDFQTVQDNNLYSQAMLQAKKHHRGIWALPK